MFLKLYGRGKKSFVAQPNIGQVVKVACVVNCHIKGIEYRVSFKVKSFINTELTKISYQ